MAQATVKICILLFPICLSALSSKSIAQEIEGEGRSKEITDTLTTMPPDSLVRVVLTSADSIAMQAIFSQHPSGSEAFKPNSTKAVLWSLIPGMGQIYNRKYWKLPFVYGGFMGFAYAMTWNGKNYQDYWSAYKSIIADAEAYNKLINASSGAEVQYEFNKAWTDFLPTADYQSAVNNVNYQNLFKNRKDFFRRNRDLSIILTVGFYLICMVDAYVDAELFDFDISPDLSMRIEPAVSPQTRFNAGSVGVNCSITF
ncbi:MAG: DUF5683 domain-containing protein [Tannerellaceae bacterium]|jgi:hypothetical protein|nr:DUF5683 domain-containing protein [Tannerellaceae bacterium]